MSSRWAPLALWNYTPVLTAMPALPLSLVRIDQAPYTCLKINNSLIPYLLGLTEIYRWEDKFSGTDEEVWHSIGLMEDLRLAMMTGNTLCDPVVIGGGGPALPSCMVLVDTSGDGVVDTIEIDCKCGECDTMSCVNININCGCGGNGANFSGGAGGGSGVSVSGGGAGGLSGGNEGLPILPPSGLSSLCDIAIYVGIYLVEEYGQFHTALEDWTDTQGDPSTALVAAGFDISPIGDDVAPELWAYLRSIVPDYLDGAIAASSDNDFILRAQTELYTVLRERYGDVNGLESLTRRDLIAFANQWPFIWGNPINAQFHAAQAAWNVNMLLISMEKVNNRVFLSKDKATDNECQLLNNLTGYQPIPELPQGSTVPQDNLGGGPLASPSAPTNAELVILDYGLDITGGLALPDIPLQYPNKAIYAAGFYLINNAVTSASDDLRIETEDGAFVVRRSQVSTLPAIVEQSTAAGLTAEVIAEIGQILQAEAGFTPVPGPGSIIMTTGQGGFRWATSIAAGSVTVAYIWLVIADIV